MTTLTLSIELPSRINFLSTNINIDRNCISVWKKLPQCVCAPHNAGCLQSIEDTIPLGNVSFRRNFDKNHQRSGKIVNKYCGKVTSILKKKKKRKKNNEEE